MNVEPAHQGSRFALSGRKPGAQRTGGQRGRSGGGSPGPGGSLVGEPSSFLPQAEPQATGGKKARWGRSPASRPGTGAGKVFLLRRKAQAEHSSEPRPGGASVENALPAREAVPEGEAGGRGRRPKSPAGWRWSPTRSADVKARPARSFACKTTQGAQAVRPKEDCRSAVVYCVPYAMNNSVNTTLPLYTEHDYSR